MKHRLATTFLLLACAMTPAFAQEAAAPPPDTRTGDAWVDRQLDDINRYGERYPDAFADELARYHGAPRDLVLDLLEREWAPGDIYYACALGTVSGRPCRHVVDQYTHGEGQDWQATAQRLGVQIDSPRFRRLKEGLVASYGRWGRPIEVEKIASTPTSEKRAKDDAKRDLPIPVPPPKQAGDDKSAPASNTKTATTKDRDD